MLKPFAMQAHAMAELLREQARRGIPIQPPTVRRIADALDSLAEAMLVKDIADVSLLPGWLCAACGIFNGEAKERRKTCRSCDRPREETP